MKKIIKLYAMTTIMMSQAALAQVQYKAIPENPQLEIAYAIINGNITYVHPRMPDNPLPRGLFYIKPHSDKLIKTPKAERNPVFMVTNGNPDLTKAFVWSDSFKNYVTWDNNRATAYSPGKFVDPSRQMATWRESSSGASGSRQPQPTRPQVAAIPAGMVDRDKLFDDIMGMSEDEFKRRAGNPTGKPDRLAAEDLIVEQARDIHRARFILDGSWFTPTLQDLRNNTPKDFAGYTKQEGSLEIIEHDELNPKKSDIRALHEQFPGALFLIASNFNALEGGMGNYRNNLSGMNHHPVQGEEAAMATMPATIHRRYLLDPINLLDKLTDVLTIQMDRNNTPVIVGTKKPNLTYDDFNNFQIFLHKNIPVTSGYNDDGATVDRGDGVRKPAYNKQMDGQQKVSHVYTAAHNLNQHHRKDINVNDPQQIAIAKNILRAAYEATIRAAINNGYETVVLTMLGASAFQNDPQWIVEILNDFKDLILTSDIKFYIVARHRDKAVQEDFIRGLQPIIKYLKDNKGKQPQ